MNLDEFIESLLKSLEDSVIQQPSITHVIHSLPEFRRLYQEQSLWLHRLFKGQIDQQELNELEAIGEELKNTYQLTLNDILRLIDKAQGYCLANLPMADLEIDLDLLVRHITQVKCALSYGYFKASVLEFTDELRNGFIGPSKAMLLHKEWMLQLKSFFLSEERAEQPEMQHTQCRFAHWLETLEAKLILYASGDHAFDLKGYLLLTHRELHKEAQIIHHHLRNQEYLDAQTHLDNLIKTFLLLDHYVNEAHFNFRANPYQHFIEFVLSENQIKKQLDYYFVIHYDLMQSTEVHYKQKRKVLEAFQAFCLEHMGRSELDFIHLEHNDALHIAIRQQLQHKLSPIDCVETGMQQLKKHYSDKLVESLYVRHFELAKVPTNDPHLFDSLLKKMAYDRCKENICEVHPKKMEEYHQQVMQDSEQLEIIQQHLENHGFEIHFQPIIDDQNQCRTVEALVRLPMKDKLVTAQDFLQIIEQHHLTLELDQIVFTLLKKYVPQLKQVAPMINVNIYPQSLGHLDFIDQIVDLGRLCDENDLKLMIEITEHEALLHDQVLEELHRDFGILFAIDDFGTGYSNLAKLAQLAGANIVQQAKLDGSD